MPLATKNNAIILKDGKLAESCGCCCPKHAKFEWVDEPPASQAGQTIDGMSDVGFCSCYWKDAIPLLPPAGATGCSFKGGINRGGLRNSRGYQFVFGLMPIEYSPVGSGRSGTESGVAANFYDAPTGVGQATQRVFDCQNGYGCSFLLVNEEELRIQLNYFTENTILVGLHARGSSGTIFEGETIPNSITGSGSYRYKIVASNDEEVRSLNAASLGVSLRDCDGTYIADPSTPWSVEVNANSVPPSPGSFFANFPNSVWGPFFPDGTLESWSHTFTANELTTATNGQPLLWTYWSATNLNGDTISYPGGARIASALNSAVAPYTFGGVFEQYPNPGGPACSGCQVRFQISGTLSRTRILIPLTAPTGFFGGGGGPGSGAWYQDILYFDDVLSPCFDSVAGASWDASPTRRQIYLGYWAGGYAYPQAFYTTSPATASITVH
jgi:hypothetical protein